MEIITERDLIRKVPALWRQRYSCKAYLFDPDKQGILQSLDMLNVETCSAADIAKIIGNDSWTKLCCDECKGTTTWAIQLGEEPDYESNTALLCRACFDNAVQLVNQQPVIPWTNPS